MPHRRRRGASEVFEGGPAPVGPPNRIGPPGRVPAPPKGGGVSRSGKLSTDGPPKSGGKSRLPLRPGQEPNKKRGLPRKRKRIFKGGPGGLGERTGGPEGRAEAGGFKKSKPHGLRRRRRR